MIKFSPVFVESIANSSGCASNNLLQFYRSVFIKILPDWNNFDPIFSDMFCKVDQEIIVFNFSAQKRTARLSENDQIEFFEFRIEVGKVAHIIEKMIFDREFVRVVFSGIYIFIFDIWFSVGEKLIRIIFIPY